jgi:DNA-binding transcriptional regulator YbjK
MSKPDGRLARGEERKQRLLDSAVAVVAERGSGALTHRAVASHAGVSVASVTYHFPSIGDLRTAMFDHAGSVVGLAFREIVTHAERDSVPGLAADYAVTLMRDHRTETVAVFEMLLAAAHDPSLRPLARFFNDRLAELLADYIGSPADAVVAAASIQGVLLSYCAQGIDDHEGLRIAIADLVRRFRTPPTPQEKA